jgi:uncharacterized protein (TIGR02147 family)
MSNSFDYREILQNEIQTRKLRNTSYNVSSFAKLIGLTPSRLSEILRGKVGLSVAKAAKICEILKFAENETSLFLDLVCSEHARNPKEKEEALGRLELHKFFVQYNDDQFSFIADWYHHAIIELISLDKTKTSLQISKSLGLDLKTTNEAIARLLKMNVIKEEKKGFILSTSNRKTSTDIPSEAIRKLNKQMLNKASEAIDDQEIDNRDFSIIFLSFNKSQLKLAKERIKNFRRDFMKEFESSNGRDSVYSMGVQFFELTTSFEKNK